MGDGKGEVFEEREKEREREFRESRKKEFLADCS